MTYIMGTTQVDVAMGAVHKRACHVGNDRTKCRTCKQVLYKSPTYTMRRTCVRAGGGVGWFACLFIKTSEN